MSSYCFLADNVSPQEYEEIKKFIGDKLTGSFVKEVSCETRQVENVKIVEESKESPQESSKGKSAIKKMIEERMARVQNSEKEVKVAEVPKPQPKKAAKPKPSPKKGSSPQSTPPPSTQFTDSYEENMAKIIENVSYLSSNKYMGEISDAPEGHYLNFVKRLNSMEIPLLFEKITEVFKPKNDPPNVEDMVDIYNTTQLTPGDYRLVDKDMGLIYNDSTKAIAVRCYLPTPDQKAVVNMLVGMAEVSPDGSFSIKTLKESVKAETYATMISRGIHTFETLYIHVP